jgi:hypothetical protein
MAQFIPNTTTASSIGSESTPWTSGYFNTIKIGTVTIGGSGNGGDTSKFLRYDGAWSNILMGTSTAEYGS